MENPHVENCRVLKEKRANRYSNIGLIFIKREMAGDPLLICSDPKK